MSISEKIITAANTQANDAVGKAVEKASGSTMVGGAAVSTVTSGWTISEIAAVVSLIGGLIFIAKLLLDMYVTWVKFRRGD